MSRDDDQNLDDPGTILEPLDAIEAVLAQHLGQPLPPPAAPAPAATPRHTAIEPYPSAVPSLPPGIPPAGIPPAPLPQPASWGAVPPVPPRPVALAQEDSFQPVNRPPVPRLTVLDDGDPANGEVVRLREPVMLIGRSDGAIRLPHDPLVSGRHAEIIREGTAVPFRWVLRDLGSSNGTFVCCNKTVLRPDRLIILGSRRYRLRLPAAEAIAAAPEGGTMIMDTRQALHNAMPALVETTRTGVPEIPLSKPLLSIGRPGCGNDIELDDPLIAPYHAQIIRQPRGEWLLQASPSKNGVWVQIAAIRLSNSCRFQCGEQRFLFVV